jgi:hypothetical protein
MMELQCVKFLFPPFQIVSGFDFSRYIVFNTCVVKAMDLAGTT